MPNIVQTHARSPILLALACVTLLSACGQEEPVEEPETAIEIRVQNISKLDFATVKIAGVSFGDIAAGATSEYQSVDLKWRYAALEMLIDGKKVTGQTLNFGSEKFTYKIAVKDLAAGHLTIEVIPD